MATRVKVIAPDGSTGSVPQDQVMTALAQGYKLADGQGAATPVPATSPASPVTSAASAPSDNLLTSALSQVPGIVQGLATGATKGVTDAVVGAGEMVHKIPGVTSLVDKMYGTPGLSDNAFREAHEELKPKSTSETVGKVGADIATAVLAPEESLPARVLGNALITGAQTGGDPAAMAVSGGLAGAGDLAGKGWQTIADKIRGGQADTVAAARTLDAARASAKAAGAKGAELKNAMNDPLWMQAQEVNSGKFAKLIKDYKLTGNPESDIAIIQQAPERDQEVLSALSRQMNPAKHQFGHEWSVAELGGAAIPAIIGASGGGPFEGLSATAAVLLARSLVKKYPGYAAQIMDKLAAVAPGSAKALGAGLGLAVGGGDQEQ